MIAPAAVPRDRARAGQGLIDTHCHLMDAAFDADRAAVIDRAAQAGVAGMVLVGYDLPSSRAAVDLACRLPHAQATVGIHPNSAAEAAPDDFAAVAALAGRPNVVGIGETGLDYYRDYTPADQQRAALEWHAQLAAERSLPLIVHNRQADADLAAILSAAAAGARDAPPGVLHCFSSTDRRFLERMLAVGYFVSFAGPITFKSAHDLRQMVQRVPLERLLVETDCPYLAPVPHRGQRNEPAFVSDTTACLADVLGLDLAALVEQVWANTLRVFPAFARVAQEVA